MSSINLSTQTSSDARVERAQTESRTLRTSTVVSSGSERVVVTHQRDGELKLRYSPIEAKSPPADSTSQ
jgi:hypothetical protein